MSAVLKLTEGTKVEVTTIATAAVLLDLNVSVWSGRKRDKKTSEEVTTSKGAGSTKAASVIKNLMSDDADLDAIKAYAQGLRNYVQTNTLTWTDGGTRLLPSRSIFEVTNEIEARAKQFDILVDKFVDNYSIKVSAAAFKLGALFDRTEYPDPQVVRRKFNVRYVISPVPTAGDFRVDVQNDVGEFLQKQYKEAAERRLIDLMRETCERAYETLKHMQERLQATLEHEGDELGDKRKQPKLYQSMLDNAVEMATMLDRLNVMGDGQLADCAARIRRLVAPLDIKSLRESKDTQASAKKQVEDILSAFSFGSLE